MRPTRISPLNTTLVSLILIATFAATAQASTPLLLTRGEQPGQNEYKGIIELTVNPGFDDARVSILVDGQKIAEGLQFPWKAVVDFGPTAVQHKMTVTAVGANKRRVQWHETVNRGHLPLSVKVAPLDIANRVFEAQVTAPADDPVQSVELWDAGKLVMAVNQPPFRFTVPPGIAASGFVQVTARAKSGEEAADFWSSAGDVHVETVQVRTVPLFVSVVDNNGTTRSDVDRSLFKIMDGTAEGKIVEFGKAFDQPISIAVLLDASASMTYTLGNATKAALSFVKHTLKPGDRCAVFAVQDVPRRRQELTSDLGAVENALTGMKAGGETALYDAIDSAIRELNGEKARRAIVILTDGQDTASIAGYDEAKKSAAQAGIPLYFIAYDNGADDAESKRYEDELKNLSAETGGFVTAANDENLERKYHDIELDLRAQFAIRYQIADYSKSNEWRPVRVVMASPKLTARTIRGYFAP